MDGDCIGGGAYFEAVMAFTGPASFWANDIETMNGVSIGAGPNPWPNQTAGYGDWMECDFAEFDTTNVYGFALHNWYSTVGSGVGTSSLGSGLPRPCPERTIPSQTNTDSCGYLRQIRPQGVPGSLPRPQRMVGSSGTMMHMHRVTRCQDARGTGDSIETRTWRCILAVDLFDEYLGRFSGSAEPSGASNLV